MKFITMFLFFLLCSIVGAFFIFYKRKKVSNNNVDDLINNYKLELEKQQDIVNNQNKEINLLERKILKCKKKLKMKLFEK